MTTLNNIQYKTIKLISKTQNLLSDFLFKNEGKNLGAIIGGITVATGTATALILNFNTDIGSIPSLTIGTMASLAAFTGIYKSIISTHNNILDNQELELYANSWKYRNINVIDLNGKRQEITQMKFTELVLTDKLTSTFQSVLSPKGKLESTENIKTINHIFEFFDIKNNTVKSFETERQSQEFHKKYQEKIQSTVFDNMSDIEKAEKLRNQITKFKNNNTSETEQVNFHKIKLN